MAKIRNAGNPPPAQLRDLLTYEPETGRLFWKPRGDKAWDNRYAGKQAGTVNEHGYIVVFLVSRRFYAHRIVWAMHYDEWPINLIDHINGEKGDNRIQNLRQLSAREHVIRGLRRSRSAPSLFRQCARSRRKTLDIIT